MSTTYPIECSSRFRKSHCSSSGGGSSSSGSGIEMKRSLPVSTSYGGSSPSPRDNVVISSSDRGDERESGFKTDKNGQSRRMKARPRTRANGGEHLDDVSYSKTFERLVQLSELEEEVLLLHKRLAVELELRAALESALGLASRNLTNLPRHIPIYAQELLANITLLEVAVLKLEEQFSVLQSEVGHARTEREIAELRHSSAQSAIFRLKDSNLRFVSSGFNGTLQNDHTFGLPGTAPEPQNQHLSAVATPVSMRSNPTFGVSTIEQESGLHKPQESLKDLRIASPEFPEGDHETISPWYLPHACDLINDGRGLRLDSLWKHNPLEEEEHWIPLNERHPKAIFDDVDSSASQDFNRDHYLAPVPSASHEDSSCFSPAITAKPLREQGPYMVGIAKADGISFLPVAEVLWKPSTVKPSAFSKGFKNEIPVTAALATKPDSWSFTSEDDHPRFENGCISNTIVTKDQSWAQIAETPSVDERGRKNRIGILKVREMRRQGTLVKNSEKGKSGGIPFPINSPVHTEGQNENGYEIQKTPEIEKNFDLFASFKKPNELSELMVRCMISIYRQLAHSNIKTKVSPTSTSTPKTNPSASSLAESSFLSVARSPLVDLRSKTVLGNDDSPDPFKARDKIPWADIGPYAHVLEVSWLSVGKDQLEFAADALRTFKKLVEQLSKVDPSHLKHEEKLAFWINLYNTLLMHAYLAYGIPKSDVKFLALLQKAAYTVGGYSFNAATMAFCLLRSKSTAHRSQLTILKDLHKNNLTKNQSKFGIDHPESLVSFGLCSGTRSSPVVRVYTSEHVKSQLEGALLDYTRAAVGISTKGRLLVPKLLHDYARQCVEDADLLDWICHLLPSNQVAVVFECIQQRRHRILGSRNFTTLPYDFTFRYLFPAEAGSKWSNSQQATMK
ncbi:uncharacterized protein [Physcomitrium patens]|uniref:DUF547 domain-containing protein n=2 Tax=Physcomitrium patens TaxID=3218 RepID=A0A2K1ICQ7_PHYPA|nr:hypothetical protein PHYPA_030543 [Physcomitrium patens]